MQSPSTCPASRSASCAAARGAAALPASEQPDSRISQAHLRWGNGGGGVPHPLWTETLTSPSSERVTLPLTIATRLASLSFQWSPYASSNRNSRRVQLSRSVSVLQVAGCAQLRGGAQSQEAPCLAHRAGPAAARRRRRDSAARGAGGEGGRARARRRTVCRWKTPWDAPFPRGLR